jgi:uncharacterized membrane protein
MSQSGAGMADNVASALCYALTFITGILFLVLEPYNKNRVVRFHAFQSIFLGVGMVIVSIALGIFDTMLWHLVGFWLVSMLSSLIHLAFVILWLYMLITTFQGRTTVLPVIGPLAQQQAG